MESTYPQGPGEVPDNLSKATSTYTSRVWLASVSLVFFLSLYLSLTAFFGWKTYSLVMDMIEGGFLSNFQTPLVALGSGFFTAFLLKGLFFIQHSDIETDIEVTEEQEPDLFDFLHQLADEAGAPRPHRVFLSGRVNASVYYDLTLLNLIVPTRKNLEIGLALVNALTLSELKAVLAHEFGHFGQRSMAVGRWIYTAQQVANHIIYKKDIMDDFLAGLSRFDLRIAWVGWLLSLVVWSLRALLDGVFSLVILAQRSLSRQMEFNADLVSVSLAGSDALVNALYKLSPADDAWERTLKFAGRELNQNRVVPDLFVMQKFVSQQMKSVLADEYYDQAPPVPDENPESHRVFNSDTLLPPGMWSTHPVNRAREDNAKENYIKAALDNRSAWCVFKTPKALREEMTEYVLGLRESEPRVELTQLKPAEAVEPIRQAFNLSFFNRRFKGVYLNRELTRHVIDHTELYSAAGIDALLECDFDELYPESFASALKDWNNAVDEKHKLLALKEGRLRSPGGVIRHRGNDVHKSDLPKLLESLESECDEKFGKVSRFDQRCRTVPLELSKTIAGDWAEYLQNSLQLLHYAEHSRANLIDAQGFLANTWQIAIADQKVTPAERKRLLEASNDVYKAVMSAWRDRESLLPSQKILGLMDIESWVSSLPEALLLAEPSEENLGEWLEVVDNWLSLLVDAYQKLSDAALQELLASEFRVHRACQLKKPPGTHPELTVIPENYVRLLTGMERERQSNLDLWSRFQAANGLVPGLVRFAVAMSLVGAVLWFGQSASMGTIHIYNGFATPVVVTLGDQRVELMPDSSAKVEVATKAPVPITTKTFSGVEIESLDVVADNSVTQYVYNIAGASPLLRWYEIYGEGVSAPDSISLGNPKWTEADAAYVLEEPPKEITTHGNSDGGTRSVISGLGYLEPKKMQEYADAEVLQNIAQLRLRYDLPHSENIFAWVKVLEKKGELPGVMAARIVQNEDDIIARRYEQDNTASDEAYSAVCAEHQRIAGGRTDSANWQFLAARCQSGYVVRREAYLAGHERYPEHGFFAYRAAQYYSYSAQWQQALDAFLLVYDKFPSLRVSVAQDTARIGRVLSQLDRDSIDALSDYSEYLDFVHALEVRVELPDGYTAYQQLHRGEFDQALATAQSIEERRLSIVHFIAASDTASDAQVLTALSLPIDSLDDTTVFTAVALALKQGNDISEMETLFRSAAGEDSGLMFEFVNLLISDGFTEAKAEAVLDGADPANRGFAYSMALTYFGDQAPSKWRALAKKLLFTYERPYFN